MISLIVIDFQKLLGDSFFTPIIATLATLVVAWMQRYTRVDRLGKALENANKVVTFVDAWNKVRVSASKPGSETEGSADANALLSDVLQRVSNEVRTSGIGPNQGSAENSRVIRSLFATSDRPYAWVAQFAFYLSALFSLLLLIAMVRFGETPMPDLVTLAIAVACASGARWLARP